MATSTLTVIRSDSLRRIWRETGGRPWAPRNPTGPQVALFVATGWVRRIDGRCGFERLPEAMLEWTVAGKFAMRAWDAVEAAQAADPWSQIADYDGCGVVLVSRAPDKLYYQPTTAFRDAGGTWRVFRSEGGMAELGFEPTHFMPTPPEPVAAT